jgi:hypothetical protein
VKVHYDEGIANHIGPEPCDVTREGSGEAWMGDRVDDLHRLPGIVDEQPLSDRMVLPLGRRQGATPPGVENAKPAVAVAARYSSQSGSKVTPGRRSSACRRGQSGCSRVVSAAMKFGGVNRLRSNAASSSSAGTGQVMPATAARRGYSATV